MINQIHSAESGKINVAPNVLASKAVEVSEHRVGILEDAVRAVLSSIPAPSGITPLSTKEQKSQPAVNAQFIQMVAGTERQYVAEQYNQITSELTPTPGDVIPLDVNKQADQAMIDAQFAQLVDVVKADEPHIPVTNPNAFISLSGDEHPNQLAIDEAMRNAMAAYDDSTAQDVRV